jgi:hypothetical protein
MLDSMMLYEYPTKLHAPHSQPPRANYIRNSYTNRHHRRRHPPRPSSIPSCLLFPLPPHRPLVNRPHVHIVQLRSLLETCRELLNLHILEPRRDVRDEEFLPRGFISAHAGYLARELDEGLRAGMAGGLVLGEEGG